MSSQNPDLRKVEITPRDMLWIEKVVYDEARGEGVEGRNAVRAVIYNRLAANRRDFGGNTVLGVLNAPKQFQGVMEKGKGDVRRLDMPGDLQPMYMQEHLEFLDSGNDPTNGATFFQNPGAARNPYQADGGIPIGNHIFYDNYQGNRVNVPEYSVALQGFRRKEDGSMEAPAPQFSGSDVQTLEMLASAPDLNDDFDLIDNPPATAAAPVADEDPVSSALSRQLMTPSFNAPAMVPPPQAQPAPQSEIRIPTARSGAAPSINEPALRRNQPVASAGRPPASRQRVERASQLNPVRMATGGLVDGEGQSKEDTMKTYKYACGGMMAPDMIMGYEEESGNPIPVGSLPSEVADDVPALLSEGEVVIPADVVRWHGLKHIMEMRTEAKMGLMSMAAEGLIQGPGMESEEDYEEDDSDEIETPEGNVIDIAGAEIEEEEYEYEDEDAEYAKEMKDYVGDDEIILLIKKDPSAFKY